jgi:hypothetical protein
VSFNEQGFLAEECYTFDWVSPRSIKVDADSQLRDLTGEDGKPVGVDEIHVQSIVDSIADRALDIDIFGSVDRLPLVVQVGKGYEIVSGFHRVAALKLTHAEKLPVRVLTVPEGTSDSTLQAAVQLVGLSENEHSGAPLKMSKRDRLKTLKRMLGNPVYQAMSSTQLAKLTGISDKTITAVKRGLGVDPERIVTSDGKERSSSVKREPRADSPIEILRRENGELKRDLKKYKAACQKLEDGLRLRVAYGELLESLLLWITEEPEESTDPTVDSTPQLEDGTIIDVTPEPETESPALPAPVVTTPETFGEQFELVMSKIEQSDGSEKSLNQLCGKNWAKYRKEMSEDQVSRIEEAARSKGLTVQTRNSGSNSKIE